MTERDRDVDVVVIGMGPGGEDAAGRLAEAGLDVVGVEARLVGGECPYWGCVPSKMMIRAADLLAEARRVDGMAGTARVAPTGRRSPRASATRPPTTGTTRSPSNGSTAGRARPRPRTVTAPGEVTVRPPASGDRGLRARRGIVLNTGTEPADPADRRPGRHAVLDQPRGDRGRARCRSR